MPSQIPGPMASRSPSILERGEAVFEAYEKARVLAPAAVTKKTGYELGQLLKGLLPGLLQTLIVLAATTTLGAVAGGVIGFFFGGVGAAPGAVIGGEIGLEIGTAVLSWLGLAFLAAAIVQGFGELWTTLSVGIKRAWAAPESPEKEYPHEIDDAANALADAVGIFVLLILQGIVAWVFGKAGIRATKGALAAGRTVSTAGSDVAAAEAVGVLVKQLRASKLGSGFADWVEENWPRLRDDPKLRIQPRPPVGDGPGVADGKGSGADRTTGSKQARTPISPAADGRATATEFMQSNQRYKPEKIPAYLDGIDLSKPVQTRTLQPGDEFVVWEHQGAKPGDASWATFDGVSPDEVGILPEGRTPVTYVVQQPVTVLESTAESYPTGVMDGIGGTGGGPQLCMPDNWIQSVARK
jgi:hypothetical protein